MSRGWNALDALSDLDNIAAYARLTSGARLAFVTLERIDADVQTPPLL